MVAAIRSSSGVNIHLNLKFTAINVIDAEPESRYVIEMREEESPLKIL